MKFPNPKLFKFSIRPHLFYLIVGLILYPFLKNVIAQDEISYISIATKYYDGNFKDAINGIWSPLISWFLIPFLFLKLFPPYAFKIVQLLIGVFALNISSKIFENLTPNKLIREYYLFTVSVVILYFVYFNGTPDLLLATSILCYIYIFMKNNFAIGFKKAIAIGVLGALIYYSKNYGFPFFICHLTLMCLILFLLKSSQRKKIISFYFIALFVFLMLSSVWIILIANKYGTVNYSLTGIYNYNLVGPKYKNVHTMRLEILYPPVNETAVSYWEDPSFLKVEGWSPFDSWNNFLYQLNIVAKNIKSATFHIFSSLVILSTLLLFNQKLKKKILNKQIFFLFFSISIYLCGLLLIMIEERFLIFPIIGLICAIFFLLAGLFEKFHKLSWKYKFILALVVITLSGKQTYSIIKNLNQGKSVHRVGLAIKNNLNLTGNVASFSADPLNEDWANSMYITYINNSKYFGEVNRRLSDSEIVAELSKYHIKYFFIWDESREFTTQYYKQIMHYEIDYAPMFSHIIIQKYLNVIYNIFDFQKRENNSAKNLRVYKRIL